jgi:cytochrome c oxidase assembly factor 1
MFIAITILTIVLELDSPRRYLRTVPLFLLILTGSALAIFNYQKSSSSVIGATLYSLRTNNKAREILGDEIYFKHSMPWIWGEMNQLHGRINVSFSVKGNKDEAMMRFKSMRDRSGKFTTEEWSLTMKDGSKIHLLEGEEGPLVFADERDGNEKAPGSALVSS